MYHAVLTLFAYLFKTAILALLPVITGVVPPDGSCKILIQDDACITLCNATSNFCL